MSACLRDVNYRYRISRQSLFSQSAFFLRTSYELNPRVGKANTHFTDCARTRTRVDGGDSSNLWNKGRIVMLSRFLASDWKNSNQMQTRARN